MLGILSRVRVVRVVCTRAGSVLILRAFLLPILNGSVLSKIPWLVCDYLIYSH